MNTFISTANSATIVLDGQAFTISSSHPNFRKVVKAGAASEWKKVKKILTKKTEPIAEDGHVKVLDDGTVTVDNREVAECVADRVHAMVAEGLDISGIARFIEHLDDNPDASVRERLYAFMDASNIGISQDGMLGLYKRVREDFTDVHSGTFDNSPGAKPKMARADVDANHRNTCSRGLHVCSEGYLGSFSGSKVVYVKVNPAHVVAVPHDYNDSKMRVSEYEVVADITDMYLGGELNEKDAGMRLTGLVTSREAVTYQVEVNVDLGHKIVQFVTEVEAIDTASAGALAIKEAYEDFGPMVTFDVVSTFEIED